MISADSGSKAAINTITRSLAKELGPKRIRVNRPESGHGRDRGLRGGGIRRQRVRASGGAEYAAWPGRPPGRDRFGGRVPSIRRRALGQRGGDRCVGRGDLGGPPEIIPTPPPPPR